MSLKKQKTILESILIKSKFDKLLTDKRLSKRPLFVSQETPKEHFFCPEIKVSCETFANLLTGKF